MGWVGIGGGLDVDVEGGTLEKRNVMSFEWAKLTFRGRKNASHGLGVQFLHVLQLSPRHLLCYMDNNCSTSCEGIPPLYLV